MTVVTTNDIPLLRSLGFEQGISGTTWFGKTRDGVEYQAIPDDDEKYYFVNVKSRLHESITKEMLYDMFEKE